MLSAVSPIWPLLPPLPPDGAGYFGNAVTLVGTDPPVALEAPVAAPLPPLPPVAADDPPLDPQAAAVSVTAASKLTAASLLRLDLVPSRSFIAGPPSL
jgi:hypothetical protein